MKTSVFFTFLLFLGLSQFAFSQAGKISVTPNATTSSTQVKTEEEPNSNDSALVSEIPKPINMLEIRKRIGYPIKARKKGIQGEVLVRILVGEDGKYIKHLVIKPGHPLLLEEIEKEIPFLTFTPAISGGKLIKFWVNIPFKFKLQDDIKKKIKK
ncbi:MAG: energy transducer TonB [Ferruginibacter sp.]